MENWNAFLKRYKREHNLSQLKLAERLGMTQGGVGHWLRGTRRPTLETINEKLEKLGLVFLEAQVMVVERDILREALGAMRSSSRYQPKRCFMQASASRF